MKKILVFAGSSSKNSINKQLAVYAAQQFQNVERDIIDLNDYEMPLYSVDKEKENGIHSLAHDFYAKIGSADFIILSLAEHNGAYSSAFKNILDWTSRINNKTFQQKPMLLMATATGARGGATVLEIASKRFPFQGADINGTFSLPTFQENFDAVNGIINPELKNKLIEIINAIEI